MVHLDYKKFSNNARTSGFMFVFLNHDGGTVEHEDRGEDDEQNSLSKRRRVGVAMEKVEKCYIGKK